MKHARSDYNRIVDTEHKIPADEPVFLLRGQDELAASAVEFYAMLAQNSGRTDIAASAYNHADAMRQWPKKKLPDMPQGVATTGNRLKVGERPITPKLSSAAREVTLGSLQAAKRTLTSLLVAGLAFMATAMPAKAQVDTRGWMVIAGSWPLSVPGAGEKRNQVGLSAASCGFRIQAGRSDELIARIGQNRYVMFLGPYRSRGQALAALHILKRCLPDAYVTPGIDTVAEDE